MFFGLCNSPTTFQTMMNEIFADMEDVVVVYIDDIMILLRGLRNQRFLAAHTQV